MPLTPGADWSKSSHSFANGNCLEAQLAGRQVLVLDSANPDWPALRFTLQQWEAFAVALRKAAA